ncbi:MAG: helix-turn-helix transcriptional regulator [Clostridia bacterium]|nr:helix-turn-helix transcriptional regulator [Clostridia bacterium]
MCLGEKLRKLRKENGYSQQEVADILNITRDIITKYENNRCEPNVELIKKFSIFFNVSADELLEIDTKEQKEEILNEINQNSKIKRV